MYQNLSTTHIKGRNVVNIHPYCILAKCKRIIAYKKNICFNTDMLIPSQSCQKAENQDLVAYGKSSCSYCFILWFTYFVSYIL